MERIHGEALQAANLDWLLVVAVQHAGAFAQDLNRADPGTACAQDIGVEDGSGGAGKIAAGDLLDKSWDIDMRGACCGAGCIEAEEASVGLWQRSLPVERGMQIREARSGFRLDRRLLHEGRLAAHEAIPSPCLSARKPLLCTIRVQKDGERN